MKQEFRETVSRANRSLPLFIRVVLFFKVFFYLLSWFWDGQAQLGLNPTSTTLRGQVWRPITSALYMDALFSGCFVAWFYLSGAYTKEFFKGSLYIYLYFFLTCYALVLVASTVLVSYYTFTSAR